MNAHAPTPLTSVMQRSHGDAHVGMRMVQGRVRLADLRQVGSGKAILPRVDGPVPEVVFLNTSGGLTGGDRLHYGLTLGEGCRAVATTQTAERAYLAGAGVARVDVQHRVGAGAWLDWLPQETILYQGAALERRTEIDLGDGAGCLLLETVVLGRAAMGESVTELFFRDTRLVRRAGRLALLDPLAFDDTALAAGRGVAVLGGMRAFATLAMIGPGVQDALAPARAALGEDGVQAAASAFDGKLVVRMLAADGWPLRRQVVRVLGALRGQALPRVWQN